MSVYDVDTSDPGKAARVAWAAAVLFGEISGMNAENDQRKACGHSMAYTEHSYQAVIEDARAALGAGTEGGGRG